MEEPDRGATKNVGVDAKITDSLTASLSSEDADNWTLLGTGNDRPNKEPSGVQEIAKEEEPTGEEEADQAKEKSQPVEKKRHDSHRSTDSQLDESSDGISVISESDAASCDKLPIEEANDEQGCRIRFRRNIDLHLPDYVPLTPPFTPDEVRAAEEEPTESKQQLQVEHRDDHSLETVRSLVEHSPPVPVSSASWIIFGLLATAMAAVILGNSMRLQNRVDEINFEHEKRISELELENNILKNEMNKLRHLYTRSELDEQVQRAEFEWMDALRQEAMAEPVPEPLEPIPEAEPTSEPTAPQQPPVRKVPPQDGGVKRKVVWSGDEEEPMLIVDKDYVLPAFCYNQDKAVQDDLFSEYSAKYCDVKKRKIEAKQRKSEFQQKRHPKQENYNKFINPKPSAKEQQQGPIEPGKLASPFNIDYKKAFDAIKAEGSVIVEALGSILDLSPEPEDTVKAKIEEVIPPDGLGTQSEPPSAMKTDHVTNGQKNEAEGQKYHDRRQDNNRPVGKSDRYEDDVNRSSEDKPYNKRKDDSYRAKHDNDRKQKKGREDNGGGFEGKDRQQVYRERDSHEHKKYDDSHEYHGDDRHEKSKYQNKQNRRSDSDEYRRKTHHHDDDDDDDEDDHYRRKFEQREKSKDRDHKHQQQRNTKWRQGSGERPKHVQGSGEGSSYLEQYKREEWKHGRQHGSGDHHGEFHKQQKKNGHKQGDWNDKRSKGRDEYRQGGGKHRDRGSGEEHWQERMKHGRQEARDEQRKQMDRENNWYLERGNQREEERIFHQPVN
uniref:Uncharacterized protein n=1 Tax=Anopheles dirus TaxID=7168 RepID=A0A182NR29_9DIPT